MIYLAFVTYTALLEALLAVLGIRHFERLVQLGGRIGRGTRLCFWILGIVAVKVSTYCAIELLGLAASLGPPVAQKGAMLSYLPLILYATGAAYLIRYVWQST